LWSSYIDQIIGRDLALLGRVRDPIRLRRYVSACAAHTAGLAQHKTIHDAAGVARNTGVLYDSALESMYVIDKVPAWNGSQLRRMISTPKRYLVEPALMGPLLNIDERSVLRDADLLGRLVDSFVAAQLRAELSVAAGNARLFHVRDAQGRHEVDLLIELAGGHVIAIEVKATSRPVPSMAANLVWLRDQLGDRFVAGLVLHCGPITARYGDRIAAAPIASIWSMGS
jgi:predicted AAA+ superfamily ATPase